MSLPSAHFFDCPKDPLTKADSLDQASIKFELETKTEEHSRCVHVAGEWLGRGNTAGEVVEFRNGKQQGS